MNIGKILFLAKETLKKNYCKTIMSTMVYFIIFLLIYLINTVAENEGRMPQLIISIIIWVIWSAINYGFIKQLILIHNEEKVGVTNFIANGFEKIRESTKSRFMAFLRIFSSYYFDANFHWYYNCTEIY